MVMWDNTKLETLMRIETGSRNTEDKIDGARYPFFVRSQEVESIDNYAYDCEAVLTAGDGVGTGKVFHYINGKFNAHQRVYVMSQFNGIDGTYFYYYFSHYFLDEVAKYTAKSSVDSVRRAMIADMEIPLPPLPEQRRIAATLSDTDAHIAAFENLIAKKRAIKLGAMQELLTGKRRLPGFSGEWVEKPLGKLLKAIPSKPYQILQQEINSGGSYPVVSQSDNFIEGYSENKAKLFFNNNGVIIFGDHTLVVKFIDFNFIVGADGVKILSTPDNNVQFIYYVLHEAVNCLDIGYSRHYNQLLELNANIPTDENEQTAISEILSDMDAEIDKLISKLNKLRNIKQGMMSELLTGKIRLIEEDTENGEN